MPDSRMLLLAMKRMRVRRSMLLLVGVLLLPRLLASFIATPVTLSAYAVLDRAGVDDELPVLSLGLSSILFWPFDKSSRVATWRLILQGSRQPNDLLAFAVSRNLASRSTRSEARALFLEEAEKLYAGPCERKYLVATLLPLAEQGGVARSRSHSVIDAYQNVGRQLNGAERSVNDKESCETYQRTLGRFLRVSG